MQFCKSYNAATQDKIGTVIPVEITVFDVSCPSLSRVHMPCPACLLLGNIIFQFQKHCQAWTAGRPMSVCTRRMPERRHGPGNLPRQAAHARSCGKSCRQHQDRPKDAHIIAILCGTQHLAPGSALMPIVYLPCMRNACPLALSAWRAISTAMVAWQSGIALLCLRNAFKLVIDRLNLLA